MRLGVIGCGKRIRVMLKTMKELSDDWKVTAITDTRDEEIKNELKEKNIDTNHITFYRDVDKMLLTEELDGVLIGTHCSLHAKMAIKVMKVGVPLFLEKPIATNMNDLLKLRAAYEKYYHKHNDKIVVSFPLRFTPLLQLVKEIIDSGKVGTIEHAQAINNVPYGSIYFHDWYRDENETGGMFLQKATHDFDYINYVLGFNPVNICAMTSKQVFKGNKPAGLMCKDCSEQAHCPESPFNLKNTSKEPIYGQFCSFAQDTGNEDSGSAIIEYDTGMHVNYSQNFFVRKGAGARGTRFMGYKGSLEFDWRESEIKVFMHHTPRVETYKIDTSNMPHFGGDIKLAANFIDVIGGRAKTLSSFNSGVLSVLMCLKAKESASTMTFQSIKWIN
jgi:predicted dehydrogenase